MLYYVRSAQELKKVEEDKLYQAIDYDAPIKTEQSTTGLGTKVQLILLIIRTGNSSDFR